MIPANIELTRKYTGGIVISEKCKYKNQEFIKHLGYAINGVIISFRERNIRIHYALAIIATFVGLLMNINAVQWCLIILVMALVISQEMHNTAIEKLCDLITLSDNDGIKDAKDLSAGGVLIPALAACAIAGIIFGPIMLALYM